MNEQSSHSTSHASAASSAAGSAAHESFRWSRVLPVILPIVVLAAAAVGFFGFMDGMTLIHEWTRPPLVRVTGKVVYNGQPLANGRVWTQPVRPGLRGSIGFTDEEGNFVLQFDDKGHWVEGAYVGEHKVAVAGYGPQRGPAPPDLLTPPAYESFDTTPLKIVVTPDAGRNVFTLTLEGQPGGARSLSGGPGGGGPPAGGPGGERGGRRGRGGFGGGPPPGGPPLGGMPAGGRGRGPVSPQTMVEKGMETFDKDANGKLDNAELREAAGIFGEELLKADTDGDGFVTPQEMLRALGGTPAETPPANPQTPAPPHVESPQTKPPLTESPQKESPQKESPQTEAPQTEAPQTEEPASGSRRDSPPNPRPSDTPQPKP